MNTAENCRVCGSSIEQFMTFGQMPIANGFLLEDQFKDEYFFEMKPSFCEKCFAFQLIDQPDANQMFNENYPFYSSLSKHMKIHFEKFAKHLIEKFINDKRNSFVIELGSNDGIMLKHFKNVGIPHLGVEPSGNVAEVSKNEGINTISEFFNENLAKNILSEYGNADIVYAANVMCHIPDLNSVFSGISKILKPKGVLVFEDPYLGDMLTKVSYDQIYDEHVYIFSASSVASICEMHNLEIIDLVAQPTHGGSMRYYIAPKGSYKPASNVDITFKDETQKGFKNIKTYLMFKENCQKSKRELVALLEKVRDKNKRVVGYGATSKSTTILNYSGIDKELIEFISDTTPLKQNKFSPGMHIPIKPYEAFIDNPPDYALLFAWNHANEIFEKETNFIKNGGKWIRFVPKVEIV